MARAISSRTVVNRQAISAIREGIVAGMEDLARGMLDAARPNVPDEPPIGKGLVDSGDYGIWVDGRKVAGRGAKPRAVRVKQGVTLVVGYGFPGRFNELGTEHQPARPFLTPAVLGHLPDAHGYLKPKVQASLRGVR